jgi:hypothetical protein
VLGLELYGLLYWQKKKEGVIFIRLWHQFLIPYLDRQRLLGQHRKISTQGSTL